MYALGLDFFAAGMLDRAESVFQELLESNTKWISKADICSSLRTIYEQTQEWQKAVEATDCIKKNSKRTETSNSHINNDSLISHYYCELADQALGEGNLHEVDRYIVKAKKAYKLSTRLMTLQGDVALHQKHYEQALKYYMQAVQEDSRLLNMLVTKIEDTANQTGDISFVRDSLLKLFKKNKDRTIFEVILSLSTKYKLPSNVDTLISETLSKEKLNIESIYKATEYINNGEGDFAPEKGMLLVNQSLANYLKGVPAFRCEHCGYKMHDYLWRCPACHHWDTVDHA